MIPIVLLSKPTTLYDPLRIPTRFHHLREHLSRRGGRDCVPLHQSDEPREGLGAQGQLTRPAVTRFPWKLVDDPVRYRSR